jgi:hypothetical protein
VAYQDPEVSDDDVAAIVFREKGEVGSYAPCGAAFGIPEVIVEEHLDVEAATVGRMTRVEANRGPDSVIVAMEKMIA